MNNVVKIENGQSMGRIEALFAGLNQRDKKNGLTRGAKLKRAIGAVGLVAVAIGIGVGGVTNLPDTHSDGIVRVDNPDVNLKGQGTSGDKDFDAALNLVNKAVADGEGEGLNLNVSQQDRVRVASDIAPSIAKLDQDPRPNYVDIDGKKVDFVANFQNGQFLTAGFKSEHKQ